MMKKYAKGFTLIECIVAMAIMGIASLLMVQVYGTVAKINSDNRKMNNSIEAQMEYAEEQIKDSTKYTGVVTQTVLKSKDSSIDKMKFSVITDASKTDVPSSVTNQFSSGFKNANAEIELYVIGIDPTKETNGSVNYDDNNVRYKFILPDGYDPEKGEATTSP